MAIKKILLKMARPLPQNNVQEGVEPITITLQISSPTIEPQLIISFTAQNFKSSNIFIL